MYCTRFCLPSPLQIGLYDLEIETRFDFTRARTRRSVERSLELLRVDYIDLIQVWGFFGGTRRNFGCYNNNVLKTCLDPRR